jgi:hypothetical protein
MVGSDQRAWGVVLLKWLAAACEPKTPFTSLCAASPSLIKSGAWNITF